MSYETDGLSEVERAAWRAQHCAFVRYHEKFRALLDGKCRLVPEAYDAASSGHPQSGAIWRVIARKLRREYKLPRRELDELRALGLELVKADKARSAMLEFEDKTVAEFTAVVHD